ncbi:MAG TPA: ABATE domain-containing protein [Fimbriimonadaceae bacterium]|nr:ABATE domain-containing protein [Fimbriimonadaceae bacterium]
MVDSVLRSLGLEEGDEPLCVQFVNTVGSRNTESPNEYLATPGDLKEWLLKRRIVPAGTAIDEPYRARTLQLRDALYRIFSAVADGREPGDADLEALNDELCEALAKLELLPDLSWALHQNDPLERALILVSLSATDLLTGEFASRIRECANEGCGWIFIDHSKNRTRRWCSMSDCGNLAKARRFQERKRASRESP